MDSQPILFYVAKVENDFPIIFISKNVKNITGYGSRELIENPLLWSGNIVADDEVGVLDSPEQLIASGSGDYEYKWKCADGSIKWFLDNFTIVTDEKGEEFIHGSRIDITKLKNADLRKMVFSKGMDEMLFMISHKVRHSISQILGLSALIEEESITEEEIKKITGYLKEPTESLNLFTEELTHLMDELKKKE